MKNEVDLQRLTQVVYAQVRQLWLVGVVTAACVLPVFLVNIPAMNDYPGHLARMYLLSSIGTPDQNPYYYFYLPYIYPNLAVDLIVPAFAKILGVANSTKAFLILSDVLVVSGAVALEYVMKRRYEFAGFAGAAVLYCLPFAWGFLNFEFGIGVSLWGLASWFALKDQKVMSRLGVHALVCCSLYVCHLVAFGLYGATLFFNEVWRTTQPNVSWRKSIQTLFILVAPAAIILGYFLAFAANGGEGSSEWNSFAKFLSILHGMNGYSGYLSIANFLAIMAASFAMYRSEHLSIMPEGKWIAIGLLILIVALPFRMLGGDLPSLRVAIGALLILPAFSNFRPTKKLFRVIPPVILSLIALTNAGHTASRWLGYREEFASLEASFAQIRRGAFVLVGHANFEGDRFDKDKMPIMTATALAAHYSNAFVPTLFTIPGQQPMQVCPQLKDLALVQTKDYWPVSLSALVVVANGTSAPNIPAHVRNWVRDYDYLYLIGPPGPNRLPDRLIALTTDEAFTLYRIIKPAGEKSGLENARQRYGNTSDSPPDGCLKRAKALAWIQ